MRKIGLIAIDLDGTLLSSENNMRISERNVKALEKAIGKGIKVAIITGRNYLSAKTYLRTAGRMLSKEFRSVFKTVRFSLRGVRIKYSKGMT